MRREALGFPISLDVENRHAVVLAGDAGDEADDKIDRLLEAGAYVTVLTTEPSTRILAWATAARIQLLQRAFDAGDCNSADLVLVCVRDPELAKRACAAAEAMGAACWSSDNPEESHLAMPAVARAGNARFAISTGGGAPALSGRLRAVLERDLGAAGFDAFVAALSDERDRLRLTESDPERRRAALLALLEGFDLTVAVSYPPWFKPPAA